jgi:hypothetical protein
MIETDNIVDNEFLRQFEYTENDVLSTIEYALQDRKIFLTKLSVSDTINNDDLINDFIKAVLDIIKEKESLSVMPTDPSIVKFIRKNRMYKSMLPVGVRI